MELIVLCFRNFVKNNYWFLDSLSPHCVDIVIDSPQSDGDLRIREALRRSRKAPGRGTRTKRNYAAEETQSSDSESDDECFLNIKSRKLALMRKHAAGLRQSPASPAPSCSHAHHCHGSSVTESPPCSSQDINFQKSFSEPTKSPLTVTSEKALEETSRAAEKAKTDHDINTTKAKKRFTLSSRRK